MRLPSLAALALFSILPSISAQMAGTPPTTTPGVTKHQAPQPAKDAAPGGGPDKVWVNTNSSVYHCFGDRYYGKTAHGRYMTESAAKSAGAHGPGNKPCPAAK